MLKFDICIFDICICDNLFYYTIFYFYYNYYLCIFMILTVKPFSITYLCIVEITPLLYLN